MVEETPKMNTLEELNDAGTPSLDTVPVQPQEQEQAHSSDNQAPAEEPTNEKYNQTISPLYSHRMLLYLYKHMRELVEEKESIRSLFVKYQATKGQKAREAVRRQLNMLLLGVYGLREGRTHLNNLRDEMNQCIKADPWKMKMSAERRNTIDEGIRYIFSGYDHKDYPKLVQEYENLKKENKLQRLLYSDLGIPPVVYKPSPNPNKKQKLSKRMINLGPIGCKGTKKQRRKERIVEARFKKDRRGNLW